MNTIVPIVIYLSGLVFAAGGAWFALKEAQKHVNGLGAKVNAIEKERNDRHTRLSLALMVLASEDQKKTLVMLLNGKTQ